MNDLRSAILTGQPRRNRIADAVRLMGKVIRHPDRAVLRMLLWSRLALPGPRVERERLLTWVSEQFGVDAEHLSAEYLASDFHRWYAARRRELRQLGGPQRLGTSGDLTLEALYVIVRAAKPRVVVETGVLYGASSAHILAALACNGDGELYSIDLPHEPHEPPHDFLVPGELGGRWTLVVGDSRCELPALLHRLSAIDLFYHDSLHTYQHMTWEYQAVLPHLTVRGILSSHDVRVAHSVREIFRRNAFPAFCDGHGLDWWTFQNSGFALQDVGSADKKANP
jgi:predicted O-methyltransferase YrrM